MREYVRLFKAASIDGSLLLKYVNQKELREIGVQNSMHVLKIYDGIQSLRAEQAKYTERQLARDAPTSPRRMKPSAKSPKTKTAVFPSVSSAELLKALTAEIHLNVEEPSASSPPSRGESKFYKKLIQEVRISKDFSDTQPPLPFEVPGSCSTNEVIQFIRRALQLSSAWLAHVCSFNTAIPLPVYDDDAEFTPMEMTEEDDLFSTPPPPYDAEQIPFEVAREAYRLVFGSFLALGKSTGSATRLSR